MRSFRFWRVRQTTRVVPEVAVFAFDPQNSFSPRFISRRVSHTALDAVVSIHCHHRVHPLLNCSTIDRNVRCLVVTSRRICNWEVIEGVCSFAAVLCDNQRVWQSARSKVGWFRRLRIKTNVFAWQTILCVYYRNMMNQMLCLFQRWLSHRYGQWLVLWSWQHRRKRRKCARRQKQITMIDSHCRRSSLTDEHWRVSCRSHCGASPLIVHWWSVEGDQLAYLWRSDAISFQ